MALNSSRLPDSWCSFLFFQNASKRTSVYYQVTLTTCVVSSLLAPITMAGNALIMATVWRSPSLRTPSYILLAGLAFTDFCTGLLTQPFYVVYQLARIAGNRNILCIAGVVTEGIGYYFSSLTVIVMTIIAVERWLHMSRRSLLTVRRVIIIYVTLVVFLIVFYACHMYHWYYTNEFFSVFVVILFTGAVLCFFVTAFAYFKVFRIIRQHQSQVQTNQNAIDIEKYKKSVFTVLYILAIFLLSYVPYVCYVFVVNIMDEFETESSLTAMNVCAAIVFFSSFANPLLYYRRIKEIRNSVRSFVRHLCCKERKRRRIIIISIL